jgi:hypothetical protein
MADVQQFREMGKTFVGRIGKEQVASGPIVMSPRWRGSGTFWLMNGAITSGCWYVTSWHPSMSTLTQPLFFPQGQLHDVENQAQMAEVHY